MAAKAKKLRAVVLGGCGAQGSFAVRDMLKRGVFEEIAVADLNLEAAKKLAGELKSPRVSARKVDILDAKSLRASIEDADLVMNCTGPYYLLAPKVVDAAIEAGKDYIDFCDDIAAHEEIIKKNRKAVEKGLTILVGVGVSPGIAPLMVMHAASQMDEVDDVAFPQMIHDNEPEGPAVIYHMMANFFGKIPVIRGGKRVYLDAFEEEEEVDFGPPLGKGKVAPFGHPEIFTLPRVLPGIKNMAIKIGSYPVEVYEAMKFLAQAGLASTDPLKVKGQDVVPRDFLISLLMSGRREEVQKTGYISSMVVEVKGKKDGHAMTIRYNFNGLMGPNTGIPCSVGAEWIVQGKITKKGVVFPEECIDPKPFIDEVLKRVGEVSPLSVKETVIVGRDWIQR
ncbi:MAG: saccharopine dehydrogenase NADP-binding domain-containing protein [bacterium]